MDRGQSEIGYWVAPACWNTGIASDAVRALIAENPRKDRRWLAEVFQDNPASARVLANTGFSTTLAMPRPSRVARDAMVRTWTYIRKL